jgi:hypothetical protein
VIWALVEGVTIRAISRMTGRSKNTIVKLLGEVGSACAVYQGIGDVIALLDVLRRFVRASGRNMPTGTGPHA